MTAGTACACQLNLLVMYIGVPALNITTKSADMVKAAHELCQESALDG